MSFSLRFGVIEGGHMRPWSYHFVMPAAPLQPNWGVSFYLGLSDFN